MQHATEQRKSGTLTYSIKCKWTKQTKNAELKFGGQQE